MSKETDWLIHHDLMSLERSYESGDILGTPAHCLMSVEIDFDIYLPTQLAPDQQEAFDAIRNNIALNLSQLIPMNTEQARRKAAWLEQVPQLDSSELVNYEIYRRLSVPTLEPYSVEDYFQADDSPETTLEFVFGQGLYQTGYYDNPLVFEMRTQAAKPSIAIERKNRAVATGREVAASLGGVFDYVGDQTNFSVWVPGDEGLRPIHSLEDRRGQEVARKAAAGIMYAVRDSDAVFRPPGVSGQAWDKSRIFRVSPERDGTLRIVPDRFEQRGSAEEGDYGLHSLVLMSGFAYGVNDKDIDTSLATKHVEPLLTAGPGYQKERDLYLLRALQKSMRSDGRFSFPPGQGLNDGRGIGMLSSLLGIEVDTKHDPTWMIESLVEHVSLTPDGNLKVDEVGFERSRRNVLRNVQTVGDMPDEAFVDRLRRIRVIPLALTVRGELAIDWPVGVTFHKDLEKFRTSPSLGYIGRHVLEAVQSERGRAFTHEDAVISYYMSGVSQNRGASVDEQLQLFRQTLWQFPGANHLAVTAAVRERICGRLERVNQFLAGVESDGRASDEAESDIQTDREMWTKERDDHMALLQALERIEESLRTQGGKWI
jgi:hypothetical protein